MAENFFGRALFEALVLPTPLTPIEIAFQPGSLRADTRLNPQHVQIIHQAMLADVEDSDGTGAAARVEGFRIGGKTGTAEETQETDDVVCVIWSV